MTQYSVTGMSCAACSARVEKAVSAVEGVESCSVSLLTNSMGVEGTASPAAIIEAVEKAGYGAAVKGSRGSGSASAGAAGAEGSVRSGSAADEELLKDRETPVLKRRLIASLCILIPLMYMSMGHTMWGWPVPALLSGNHVALGIAQMFLASLVMVINQKFFINGFKSLIHRAPNMDALVALGSSASFLWSLYVLLRMSGSHGAHEGHFYFESAAMILTLITVGKMLEARSKGKTTDALKSLMRLAPKTATVVADGEEKVIPVDQVRKGDVFVVRPGENIPVDGVVIVGMSAVNEAALTGESIPVDKDKGDPVWAATTNQSGFLKCEATRVGEDTTLSQIIQMVSDAAATKAPIAKIADKVSGVFVPVVIGIAILTFIVWTILGQPAETALTRAVAVLVISCPCALGLATPVAIMVGNGMGAKHGVLFKTSASLEETGRIQVVALDKTGTITAGLPRVTDLVPAEGFTEEELLSLARSLESKSEHPLARAVVDKAAELGVLAREAEDFQALPGNGLSGTLFGATLVGGSLKYISSVVEVPETMTAKANALSADGKTPLLFARNEKLAGIIAVADVIKDDSPQAIEELRNLGLHVVMLTGDNERTAKAIGKLAGVDEVIAGVLPGGKEAVIKELKKKGKVAMVGDGINDAPALTSADIGIAIGAGSDVAIDAADVVLMKSRLLDVPAAIRLSRRTLRGIHQNLFWAFCYNVIGIPIAAGVFANAFGWQLSPMLGAAAMSLSSFCVVTNALRINLFDMYDPKKDRKIKAKAGGPEAAAPEEANEGEKTMIKTMTVKGMMCEHCEARVKKALEKLEGVASAEVSHEKGTAVVTLSADVPNEVLKQAVEDQDYEVVGIE